MAQKYAYPTHEEMQLGLLEHFEAAAYQGPADGASWYVDARREARRMARTYGVGLGAACGVIAALSPRVQWSQNLKLAEEVLRTGTVESGAMRDNLLKAQRIADGERPLAVLGGPKVRAFYRALMGDANAAVIDTWMLVAVNWPREGLSARQYERVEAALRDAARITNLPVSEFQAIVWTQVRGRES